MTDKERPVVAGHPPIGAGLKPFLFLDQVMFGHSEREEVLAQDDAAWPEPA